MIMGGNVNITRQNKSVSYFSGIFCHSDTKLIHLANPLLATYSKEISGLLVKLYLNLIGIISPLLNIFNVTVLMETCNCHSNIFLFKNVYSFVCKDTVNFRKFGLIWFATVRADWFTTTKYLVGLLQICKSLHDIGIVCSLKVWKNTKHF